MSSGKILLPAETFDLLCCFVWFSAPHFCFSAICLLKALPGIFFFADIVEVFACQ
ncbi:hypothetical protein B7P43_G13629 [Cryptotermes secundus]|uniref:Uncharacterized protein n=1 Tax=Cryptotermes secundus TaxID=105785 RepID=A0A2J7RPJ1_9NEOP|nr:hypothetical protein B7P43_G13629 [Cryptotermes secundus]